MFQHLFPSMDSQALSTRESDGSSRDYLVGVAISLAVLLIRMPFALIDPALWPDDFNYLVHVYNNPDQPVWYYVNLAGTKAYVSLVPMVEAWAYVHWAPNYLWTPYLFVGSSLILTALAQALVLHPMSVSVLTNVLQRRLAFLLIVLLPVSTIGEVTTVAIQHVSWLMIACWMVAVAVGHNRWIGELSPVGLLLYLVFLGLAIWSAPTAFVLIVVAAAGLVWKRVKHHHWSKSAIVLWTTLVLGVSFLVFGAVPGPSYLHQYVVSPLLEGQIGTSILAAFQLGWLTLTHLFQAVSFDLFFGSESKLYLWRSFSWGAVAIHVSGALILLALIVGLWRARANSKGAAPALIAVAGVAVLLVAINLAARWEPMNEAAIEGFRHWRWRYFTISQWMLAALLAVPLAAVLSGMRRTYCGVLMAIWLAVLNLSNAPKYEEFFKHEISDPSIVHYGQIKGGEVRKRAEMTREAVRELMQVEAELSPGETRAHPFGRYGHGVLVRKN